MFAAEGAFGVRDLLSESSRAFRPITTETFVMPLARRKTMLAGAQWYLTCRTISSAY